MLDHDAIPRGLQSLASVQSCDRVIAHRWWKMPRRGPVAFYSLILKQQAVLPALAD
jgi:hypothetical protein